MTANVYFFEDSRMAAVRLAAELNIGCEPIYHRSFPDGESLVQVVKPSSIAIIYRSLNRPNDKLIELMLAASALRDRGAVSIVLVAPYLAYMRQDKAFQPGEAVSQKVIGKFIATHFDALVTVDPHLHRAASLQAVVPGINACAVSGATTLSSMIALEATHDTILVGPDVESRQWVESVAASLGLGVLVGEKRRLEDRKVELAIPNIEQVRGRPIVLVDDLISTGGTLLRCAALLRAAGAKRIEAIATHCLAEPADLQALADGGVERVRSTDSVPGPTASASLVPAIAQALREVVRKMSSDGRR